MLYTISIGLQYDFLATTITTLGRAIFAVPLHTLTGIMIGSDIAENAYGNSQKKSFFQILKIPLLFHGLFDFFFLLPPYVSKDKDVQTFSILPCSFLVIVSMSIGAIYAKKRQTQIFDLVEANTK